MDAHTWLLTNLTGGGGWPSLMASWLLIIVGLITVLVFFKAPLGLSKAIDSINTWIGQYVAWMILAAVLVSTANAIVRKVFNTSSNAWLEIQWILFGAVFLLCAPWTLLANEHIRIDIVNSMLSKRVRNWIDVIGHWFFIVPICLVMLYTAIPFFVRSFGQNEQSTNAGGLPVYPAKFLIPLAFVLLLAQGISELIKRRAIMQGRLADTSSGGGHHAAAEAEAERLVKSLAEEAEALAKAKAAAAAAAGTKS
jgi:TRAP-type mannitol/chloroaromatic compound transport system permease small subunit